MPPPYMSDGCDFKHTVHVVMLLSPGENVRRGCAMVHRTCMFNPPYMSKLSRAFGSNVSGSPSIRVENSESAHWRGNGAELDTHVQTPVTLAGPKRVY